MRALCVGLTPAIQLSLQMQLEKSLIDVAKYVDALFQSPVMHIPFLHPVLKFAGLLCCVLVAWLGSCPYRSTGRPSVIVLDRGLFDPAAYMPRETWLKILERNGWTEEGLIGRCVRCMWVWGISNGIHVLMWCRPRDPLGFLSPSSLMPCTPSTLVGAGMIWCCT